LALAIGIIPARYGSTRFPGKPLAVIAGRPMIEHVWRQASCARLLDMVAVATDDRRIYDRVRGFGGLAVMTSKSHATGTDRIAEALAIIEGRHLDGTRCGKSEYEIVVNIQGDEPLVDPRAIDALVQRLRQDTQAEMATPVCPLKDPRQARDPNTVKVALDLKGRALYFSRCPIPFHRQAPGRGIPFYKHIGIYAYRRRFLDRFRGWGRGRLERAESLEQLRALENGAAVAAVVVPRGWPAVDTPSDLARVGRLMKGVRTAKR
jgi:3-deoxy-manno-octulosonate cytidylyltransferase (CMP-KDO synthetase)